MFFFLFYYFMFMLSSLRWQDVICSAEVSRGLFTLLLSLYNCLATGALDIEGTDHIDRLNSVPSVPIFSIPILFVSFVFKHLRFNMGVDHITIIGSIVDHFQAFYN